MILRQSRRRFLRKAAATITWALAVTGSQGHLLTAESESPPHRSVPSSDEQSHRVLLPYVSGGSQFHSRSKLGVHTIRPDGVLNLVGQVSAAGTQVALVKALDDFGYLQQVKDISPQTVRIARRNDLWGGGINAMGDPALAAQGRMAWHMSTWEPNREIVHYWEVLNEADPPGVEGHRWLAEFYIACMRIASLNGYKLAIFSYSVGVPEWEEWEAIVETGVFEEAKMGGHVLALHEYNWPHIDGGWGFPLPGRPAEPDRGVLTGRYRHLYEDFLIPRNQVIPLVITEAGYDPSVFGQGWDDNWKSRYVAEMAWFDDRMREDDYVIGCALFTLGGVSIWQDWDFSDLIGELANYIISTNSQLN